MLLYNVVSVTTKQVYRTRQFDVAVAVVLSDLLTIENMK